MTRHVWDPLWDGSDDELHARPRNTAVQENKTDEAEIRDAILANEAACTRRAWYDGQPDRDLRKFVVERGIKASTSRIRMSREGMIDAIMAQYMESAMGDAAIGKKEDSKRRAWYGEHSDDQLWQFITKRKPVMPVDPSQSSQSFREDMIDALMVQDKNTQFPFMKLAAELRNKVYSYLLIDPAQHTDVVDKPRINCHPNILAVCRFIQKEAWNVLYANAYVTLDLKFSHLEANLTIDCFQHESSSPSSSRSASPSIESPCRSLLARAKQAARRLRSHQQPALNGQAAPNSQVALHGQSAPNGQLQHMFGNLAQHPLPNQLQQTFGLQLQQAIQAHAHNQVLVAPSVDEPSQTSHDIRRAASNLHNELISKVGHLNICIVIAHRAVLESELRTTEIRQIVTELKDFMAKHAGREQTVCVMFDLLWDNNNGIASSGQYKKNPANKQHIFHDAIKILEPLSQVGEMKDYGHLAACQKMEVIFMVSGDISKEVVEKLEGNKQEVEKKADENKLGPTTLGCLVLTPAQHLQNEIDSRVTESIFRKHWREDTCNHESDNEDGDGQDYTLSPRKKAREDNLWDDDLGKDDDSVHFDSEDDEDSHDDEDKELFKPEDLEDEDYDLDDLIVDATPTGGPLAFHPELEKNREVKEWLKNGGFKSDLNTLREARVLAFEKKNKSGEQGHSVFGNN
ncbi:hypothetical protein FKW77_001839 [Venturia effusa]|uniref:Uncharacterized protein n=1 Tax=Venturia effusa TaxID=50376 RepID=A0A517LQT2_9PEZI|nr:hypothetical protein FKW77_001839 [Venturia effusa]